MNSNEKMQMPDIPDDGNWELWIIRVVLAVLGTMVTTIVFLARFIQGQYQTTIESLIKRVDFLETKSEKLHVESMKCIEDRAVLSHRIEQLERSK